MRLNHAWLHRPTHFGTAQGQIAAPGGKRGWCSGAIYVTTSVICFLERQTAAGIFFGSRLVLRRYFLAKRGNRFIVRMLKTLALKKVMNVARKANLWLIIDAGLVKQFPRNSFKSSINPVFTPGVTDEIFVHHFHRTLFRQDRRLSGVRHTLPARWLQSRLSQAAEFTTL